MEKLYEKALSKIGLEQDRKWIEEILKWLIVCAQQLTVEELNEASQFSLQEALLDFQGFLEIECGAFLRLVPTSSDDKFSVQLVHEAFRSYLLDNSRCHTDFYIDEANAHAHALNICLNILSSRRCSPFPRYAAQRWNFHSTNVNQNQLIRPDILNNLCHFHESEGCKTWLDLSDVLNEK
jgi:hypothetical protein